jgi:hypothetical protein
MPDGTSLVRTGRLRAHVGPEAAGRIFQVLGAALVEVSDQGDQQLIAADPSNPAALNGAPGDAGASAQPGTSADVSVLREPRTVGELGTLHEKQFTGKRLKRDLRGVLNAATPGARRLLRAIADDNLKDGAAFGRTLRQRLGDVNEGTLGAWARSIKDACRRHRLAPYRLYKSRYRRVHGARQAEYTMRPEVARAIAEMVTRNGRLVDTGRR